MKPSNSGGKEKSHQNNKEKNKDQLSPSRMEEYQPVQGTDRIGHLSHKEALDQLEVYGRIGHKMEQALALKELKAKYEDQIRQVNEDRVKADVHYANGIRSGLPHLDHEVIKDTRDQLDQKHRHEVLKEGKEHYEKHSSLSKSFQEKTKNEGSLKQAFHKSKNRNHDRDR